MIAFKTFAVLGETPPDGVSSYYPAQEVVVDGISAIQMLNAGYAVMTEEDYQKYKKSVNPQAYVEEALQSAMDFGTQCLREFSAENVLLGITQAGMTGTILTILTNVMQALLAGSLYEAIARIRAVDPADYDGTYLNATRCLAFINKIEAYLGLPLSESL